MKTMLRNLVAGIGRGCLCPLALSAALCGCRGGAPACLVAQTPERSLEAGAPVCYLSERGDTVIPYGRYLFCQEDTIERIGFVYGNRPGRPVLCIDNRGNELFETYRLDNGPDYAREGLFRIVAEDGTIGFADTLGRVAIAPRFRFAFPFERGLAKVTDKGEAREVPGSEGEKHYWESDEWYFIDKRGERAERVEPR